MGHTQSAPVDLPEVDVNCPLFQRARELVCRYHNEFPERDIFFVTNRLSAFQNVLPKEGEEIDLERFKQILNDIQFYEREYYEIICDTPTVKENRKGKTDIKPYIKDFLKQSQFRDFVGDIIFKQFDLNADGKINFDEFLIGVMAYKHKDTIGFLLFNESDKNHDGHLTKEESKDFLKRNYTSNYVMATMIIDKTMKKMFHDDAMRNLDFGMDRVSDIIVTKTKEYFQHCINDLDSQLDEYVERWFKKTDANHDGVVSCSEFKKMMSDPDKIKEHEQLILSLCKGSLSRFKKELFREMWNAL